MKLSHDREQADVIQTADLNLRRLTLQITSSADAATLRRLLATFAEDTYRMKGFVRLSDGDYLVDCVGAFVQVLPQPVPTDCDNRIALLYGYGLPARKSVKAAIHWMPDVLEIIPETLA
ncbi:MAG: hypothetical protein EOM13_10150 [Clostridia bacterium]|nr:hypothetical protein [Clostridia bacterium]